MSSIFLSHSSTDKGFVRKLAADLRNNGHTVWIDEAEIKVGDSLVEKIREGIDTVDYIAAVLSKESVKSQWVQKEIDIAINREVNEKKVMVLPLLLEKIPLPGFLVGKLYIDFSEGRSYEDGLQQLLGGLGERTIIYKSKEENEMLQNQLKEAQEALDRHAKTIDKVTEYILSTKSERLRHRIRDENESHPDYAPINNVYAFQIGDVLVTLGYLLYVLQQIRGFGSHQFVILLELEDKWQEAQRMLSAYSDMINTNPYISNKKTDN